MNGEEIGDSISILTDGTYNEKKNKTRSDILNKSAHVHVAQNTINERKYIKTKTGIREVQRALNAPCDTDSSRMGGRERFFIKGPDGTPLVEHCLYNSFLFGISNTPNLICADADGNKYYERIVTDKSSNEYPKVIANLLGILCNMCDRKKVDNMFINRNRKLINLDTENICGKFIFDNSDIDETLSKNIHIIRKCKQKYVTKILNEIIKEYNYESFLNRYIETYKMCYISDEKARHALHAFVKRAKKYKKLLVARLEVMVGRQKDSVFKPILDYSIRDLKNFNAFLKEHNSFKERLGNYKRPGFWKRVYNLIFGNSDVEPVKPLKTLVRYSGENINHQQSNQK